MTLATVEIGLEAGKIGIEKSDRMLLQKCKGEIIRAEPKTMGVRWRRKDKLLRYSKGSLGHQVCGSEQDQDTPQVSDEWWQIMSLTMMGNRRKEEFHFRLMGFEIPVKYPNILYQTFSSFFSAKALKCCRTQFEVLFFFYTFPLSNCFQSYNFTVYIWRRISNFRPDHSPSSRIIYPTM